MLSRNLLIRPISAKLLHDTEFIGKMSPYLKISFGNECIKSPACHKGHLTPSWDTELIITLPELCNSILIELFSKETLLKDHFIGSARFDLNQLALDQGFRGWIPLTYSKGDAGTIFLEINQLSSEQASLRTEASGLPSGYVKHTPIFEKQEFREEIVNVNQTQSTAASSIGATSVTTTQFQQPLNPIIHKEAPVYTKEEPFYVHERPLVHEKTIITEKPIITEKDILTCEQPIIVEKPELIERHFYQQAPPVVERREAIQSKAEAGTMLENPELYGAPIVETETEYRKMNPIYNREQAEVFEQKIVTEQPIMKQKDIYHVEKPIFIERPEFVQKPIFQSGPVVTETFNPVITTETTNEPVLLEGQKPLVHSDVKLMKHAAVVEVERPEVYEKEIIHEQRIIHEQPIVNVEKQIVQERPEFHERRIYHQEPVKVVQEEVIRREEQGKP